MERSATPGVEADLPPAWTTARGGAHALTGCPVDVADRPTLTQLAEVVRESATQDSADGGDRTHNLGLSRPALSPIELRRLGDCGSAGESSPRRASAQSIGRTNAGSPRPPITKWQRRDRIDEWLGAVEEINHRGDPIGVLPGWWRHELVVLGVRIPDPLTGAALHEALMDAQADALDTLPWPPPEDAGEKWHSPCPDCGVDWRSAFRYVDSRRCRACNENLRAVAGAAG